MQYSRLSGVEMHDIGREKRMLEKKKTKEKTKKICLSPFAAPTQFAPGA
jgi:hypothetical protein